MIKSNDDWESLVPKEVAEFLKKINAKNRLNVISHSDTRPTEY
jgi:nicotinamide-nucleotide adenylyltransferase